MQSKLSARSKKVVTAGTATIAAASTYLGVLRLPAHIDEARVHSGQASTLVLLAALGGAWVGAKLWECDWGPSALSALSASSTALFLLGMAVLGADAFAMAVVLGVAAMALSFLPWWRLRRVVRARAGRADAGGFIEFLDGSTGRALRPTSAGDVLAWPAKGASNTGYREDGTSRFEIVEGTRQEHVELERRRGSVWMVAMLASVLALCTLADFARASSLELGSFDGIAASCDSSAATGAR